VPDAAARWGKWAVSVAVIVPVFYAVTHWAWTTLGIPLGISKKFLREGQEVGLWWAGAGPVPGRCRIGYYRCRGCHTHAGAHPEVG
jgi:hypothetical protein